MPTYEYRCPDGHEFEKFYRKISDAVAEVLCPVCGKPGERRLSGGAGLHFKGPGFYLTDYGKNAHRKAAPSSDSSGTSGEKQGGESKSESASPKPEKPAEAKPAGDAKSAPAKPASKPKSDS
jgi:putative FmdB family regulatory protein